MDPSTHRLIEEYRREAAKARLRAADSPEHRDDFLRIAADWEALAREMQHLAGRSREDSVARL